MSYILRIVVPALPEDDALAWSAADDVCAQDDDDAPKAPVLVRLHDVLTSVYPCLCSDDANIDDSPWSDGPLINNFGNASATLGLETDDDDGSAVGFIVAAGRTLGLTVLDEQAGEIHRPLVPAPGSTFSVRVQGVVAGCDGAAVRAGMGRVFRATPEQVGTILATPGIQVKRGVDYLTALRYQAMLRRLGCRSSIEAEQPLAA